MFKNFFSKLLDVNQKEVERLEVIVAKINSHETKIKKLKDTDFAKQTEKFKKRLDKGETLIDLLPEAFALVREASWRKLGMRHYDVQMMASTALFEGKVAEQKTGEGKTLSAVPALYLHALTGKGVHLVTVNDYLARRDAGWNAPVFEMLGLTTASIIQEGKSLVYDTEFNDSSTGDERLAHLKPATRREAYACDILYGTNNEFGFDYLRDNMVSTLDQMVQRGNYFAIVDEVDSVLIDEARTPLIISAPDTDPTDKYYKFAEMVTKLNPDTDYKIDEKTRSASLTEHGITRVEKILGVDNLYEKDFDAIHHIENALRARTIYLKDREYVVKDGQVIIVDEFTGRLMFGRRWSDGLHQAVEAKEGVPIQQESKTLATISFQNYFRMYENLAGMTGTAATEAEEFKKIYKLDVVVIPTHREMVRQDKSDLIYKSVRAKYGSLVADIEERRKKGQPVLVGTTSIEKNEIVESLLKRKKIPHNILNAKNHEREAAIIADAGKPGAVTIATNMAGRGVDIVLGGTPPEKPEGVSREKFLKSKDYGKWKESHDKVVKAGGLHVIGTERHESRRIDNQLRGRSGRQGDPGSSRFYLSLEDDLMRIFGGEQISSIMDKLRLPEDQPIENKLVSRAIEQSQVKVEAIHFDERKRVVEYDDVKNQQREIIYKLRRKVLEAKNLKKEIAEKLKAQVDIIVTTSWPVDGEKPDAEKILVGIMEIIPFDETSRDGIKKHIKKQGADKDAITGFLHKMIDDVYVAKEKESGEELMRELEKFAYRGSIDKMWIEHIDYIDGLEQAVRLRGYGQRNPLAEFKNEAFNSFEGLLERIDSELSRRIFRVGVMRMPQAEIPLESAITNVDTTDNTGLMAPELGQLAGTPAFTGRNDTGLRTASTSPYGQQATINVTGNSQIESQQAVSTNAPTGQGKLGRNDPCPCGSGKKWKKCHYPRLPN
jgi:preprotein translocase subunit SecA